MRIVVNVGNDTVLPVSLEKDLVHTATCWILPDF
jgi:hypothetical protein